MWAKSKHGGRSHRAYAQRQKLCRLIDTGFFFCVTGMYATDVVRQTSDSIIAESPGSIRINDNPMPISIFELLYTGVQRRYQNVYNLSIKHPVIYYFWITTWPNRFQQQPRGAMRKRGLWYRPICLPVRHVRVLLMAEDIVNHLANIVGRSRDR